MLQLRVTVLGCVKLNKADKFGKSDPYVIIKTKSQKVKTTIKKQTLCPYYGENFLIQVTEGELLKVEVWDWDLIGKDDFLGSTEIPFFHLKQRVVSTDTYKLQGVSGKGKIVLSLCPVNFGKSNTLKYPSVRYMKIGGGKRGKIKWGMNSKFSEGFEVKCKISPDGKLTGKNKSDFKHVNEWVGVDGWFKGNMLDFKIRVFTGSKKNYSNTNHYWGSVDNDWVFKGAGRNIKRARGQPVKKPIFIEADVRISPIPPKLEKKMKNTDELYVII